MTSRIKSVGKFVVEHLPSPIAGPIWTLVERRWETPFAARKRKENIALHALMGCPTAVLSGPFRGMRYVTKSAGSAWLPKILGTYELELHPAVEELIASRPGVVIDIGAAEGYYAVGLALRLPDTHVVCYEIYPPARHLLRAMAKRNRVRDRLAVNGGCTTESLSAALLRHPKPVVVCDIEGAEDHFIDPSRVSELARATILIELHDHLSPGISSRIRERFSSTHTVREIPPAARTVADLPAGVTLDDATALTAMDEWRPVPQPWFLLTPLQP